MNQALTLDKISLDDQIVVKLFLYQRRKRPKKLKTMSFQNNLKHLTYHGFESDEKNHKKKLKVAEEV